MLVKGTRPHACNPGWEKVWHEQNDPNDIMDLPSGWFMHQLDLAPGSVVRCDECGQVWMAKAMLPGESPGLVRYRIQWRKPTWRECRRLKL